MMNSFLILVSLLCALSADASVPLRWKNLLKNLVDTNSSTSNPEGLEEVRKLLIPEFRALGFTEEIREVGSGHKVLRFIYPGGNPKVALIGHIDTVFEQKSSFQRFSDEGQKLRGPGVNDMKGGILMMLMVLSDLKDTGLLPSIAIILNDDEEIGSPYSASTLKSMTSGVSYGLVYEPTLTSADHVTTTHAGVEWLELRVRGRAAHAGAEHEKGINACVELAHKIVRLEKLTAYKKKLTVNPGVIQGGTKANVVCEEASVKIDIRYVEDSDLKVARTKIKQILEESTVKNSLLKRGTESSLVEMVHIPSLSPRSTEALFSKASAVAKTLGFTLKKEHMGGASDANQLAPTGMNLLGGLGPWGVGAHSVDEVMDVESFEKRKNLSVRLIKEILSSK